MNCNFIQQDDGSHRCSVCGMAAPAVVKNPTAICGSAPVVVEPDPLACRAGSALKRLLSRVGIVATEACSCNARARMMDAWGCDECERRVDEIVGWMREEATKRGLPFVDMGGRLLLKKAIADARKDAARAARSSDKD